MRRPSQSGRKRRKWGRRAVLLRGSHSWMDALRNSDRSQSVIERPPRNLHIELCLVTKP